MVPMYLRLFDHVQTILFVYIAAIEPLVGLELSVPLLGSIFADLSTLVCMRTAVFQAKLGCKYKHNHKHLLHPWRPDPVRTANTLGCLLRSRCARSVQWVEHLLLCLFECCAEFRCPLGLAVIQVVSLVPAHRPTSPQDITISNRSSCATSKLIRKLDTELV